MAEPSEVARKDLSHAAGADDSNSHVVSSFSCASAMVASTEERNRKIGVTSVKLVNPLLSSFLFRVFDTGERSNFKDFVAVQDPDQALSFTMPRETITLSCRLASKAGFQPPGCS